MENEIKESVDDAPAAQSVDSARAEATSVDAVHPAVGLSMQPKNALWNVVSVQKQPTGLGLGGL